jgi:hypothetical protein
MLPTPEIRGGIDVLETKDWIILVVGCVIGFVPALAAGLLTNPILKFLEDRKLVSQSKRFAKATRFHKLVTDLHSGTIDKYIFMMRMLVTIIVSILSAFIFGAVGFSLSLIPKIFQIENDMKLELSMVNFAFGFISGVMFSRFERQSDFTRLCGLSTALTSLTPPSRNGGLIISPHQREVGPSSPL